jgi:hypothetical protein
VPADLIELAFRAHALVARRASDDLLADALHLLRGALDLLLSRLPAECAHLYLPRFDVRLKAEATKRKHFKTRSVGMGRSDGSGLC